MTSWVHLFSKFTSEALLFEAAFICFLVGSYLAYSVVRKRREGRAGEAVPSSVVKVYLNELITDAEQMRAQLFGLLNSSGIMTPSSGNSEAGHAALLAALQAQGASAAAHGDSDLLHKISALEARMKDQARAMELLIQEKSRIEGELTLARTNAGKSAPAGASSSEDTTALQKRIAELEGKLAEYSVIEDDLANLKRLQQENTEMKARLQGMAPAEPVAAVAAVAAPTPSEPVLSEAVMEPSTEAPVAATAAESSVPPSEVAAASSTENTTADAALEAAALAAAAAPAEMTDSAADLLQATAASESVAVEEPAAATDMQEAFDQLATQVDASLSEPAMPQEGTPPTAAASPAPAAASEGEKPEEEKKRSEADLLAEFEKMLNG